MTVPELKSLLSDQIMEDDDLWAEALNRVEKMDNARRQFEDCRFDDRNCHNWAVANARIQRIAKAALYQ